MKEKKNEQTIKTVTYNCTQPNTRVNRKYAIFPVYYIIFICNSNEKKKKTLWRRFCEKPKMSKMA